LTDRLGRLFNLTEEERERKWREDGERGIGEQRDEGDVIWPMWSGSWKTGKRKPRSFIPSIN
jgi:hypothetical protein